MTGVGESARMFFNPKTFTSPPGLPRSASILDDSGSIGGSTRSMSNLSSMTWNDDSGGVGHTLTLDRLYAWEKKLYNEVKVFFCLLGVLRVCGLSLHYPVGLVSWLDHRHLFFMSQILRRIHNTFLDVISQFL
jgi:hypothetical protein